MEYVRVSQEDGTHLIAYPHVTRIGIANHADAREGDARPCIAIEYRPSVMGEIQDTLARMAYDELFSRCTVRLIGEQDRSRGLYVQFECLRPSPDAVREALAPYGDAATEDALRRNPRLRLCAAWEISREEWDDLVCRFEKQKLVTVLAYAQTDEEAKSIQFLTSDLVCEYR